MLLAASMDSLRAPLTTRNGQLALLAPLPLVLWDIWLDKARDTNHRFITELAVYNDFVGKGWTGEGVNFCVLPAQ